MIYGYIRVSTDKQTIENQRFEIENFSIKNNIKIECYNNSSESNKLGFYTNVAGWTGENSSLTEGGSSINKLYNVSVYIWKDKTDGMTIKADKTLDIADDYFTKVDSVKEG